MVELISSFVDAVSNFFESFWQPLSLAVGLFLAAGAALKWNIVVNPSGREDYPMLPRTIRRVFFFALGAILIVNSFGVFSAS